jgi:4-amino-4-deoxy-L-arabinose transferase-like glycosyltransferase
MSQPQRKSLILFLFFGIAAVLILIAMALPLIWTPLWFDQGAFAACADVLRRGGAFFRDCWDSRGPLTPILYALSTLLSQTHTAIQAFNLLWTAATCIAVGLLAWRMFGRLLPALAAGALLWLMSVTLNYWSLAQAEGFANLVFVLAALLAWHATRQSSNANLLAFFTGVLAGALFWFKYPFVVFGLFLALWLLWSERERNGLRLAGTLFAGAAISVLAGALLTLITGAWPDWMLHLRYAITQFHEKPLAERWDWLTGLFMIEIDAFVRVGSTPTLGFKDTVPQVELLGRGYPIIMLLMVTGAIGLLMAKAQRKAGVLLVGWLLVTILLNIWQGHSYRYHFIIWLPPMALLAGATLALPVPRWARAVAAGGVVVALIALFAALWPWTRDGWENAIFAGRPAGELYEKTHEAPMWRLAQFLRENAGAGDRIAVFSDAPDVYFLSQLPNATRFPYLRWAAEARDPVVREQLGSIYLDELQRNPPRYFILTQDGFPYAEARFIETWKSLPAVNHYVEDNYRFIGENGPFLLFERK